MIINAIIKFSNQFMKLNCQKHEKYGYYNLSSLPFDSTTVITKMVLLGKFHFKLPSMIKTRYDYNLTIMKFPKPATDTIYPHIKF